MIDDIVRYDQNAAAAALERLAHAPLDLDDVDLGQLEIIGGEMLASKAIAARHSAQLAVVAARSAPPVVLNKAASAVEPFDETVIDAILDAIAIAIEPLNTRIKQLEARPELTYCGAFAADRSYSPGSLVTRKGSLWLAESTPMAAPGDGASGWKMIVRGGQP